MELTREQSKRIHTALLEERVFLGKKLSETDGLPYVGNLGNREFCRVLFRKPMVIVEYLVVLTPDSSKEQYEYGLWHYKRLNKCTYNPFSIIQLATGELLLSNTEVWTKEQFDIQVKAGFILVQQQTKDIRTFLNM